MAETRIYTNDPLTRKRWSNELFRVLLKDVEYSALVGSGSDATFQMKNDLGKGQGDTLTMGIRRPLQGEGIVGSSTWTGNEESLAFKDFKFTIEELGHSVKVGGAMEEQRVPFNLANEGKLALQDWWADKLSDIVINQIAGDSRFRVAGKTLGQDPVEPDADHLMYVNSKANEAALTSSDTMDLTFLRAVKQRAIIPAAGADKLRPRIINGKKFYRVILHNYVFDNLRNNVNAAEWGDYKRNAANFKSPDIEIEYENMLISKSERLPVYTAADGTTSAYRGVFLGAQAGVIGWGGAGKTIGAALNFDVEPADHKRNTSIAGGGILGAAKTRFDGKDYGVITFGSYASALGA